MYLFSILCGKFTKCLFVFATKMYGIYKKMLLQDFACNRFGNNFFHIWKLILVQCECSISQIWKFQGLCKILYSKMIMTTLRKAS